MIDDTLFESEVRNLLKLRGWTVENEKIIGHKKVDSIITKLDEFGEMLRFAVECKHYKNKLTQNDVAVIYANYLPLIQQHLVNGILLVTENGLHPSADSFVSNASGFKHSTRSIIQDQIMDFTSFVNGILHSYESEPVSKYYIPQRPIGIDELYCDYIQKYVDETNRPHLAILGGYGTGKSCLAQYLAAQFSRMYLEDRTMRIPILIDLGSISSDQSLEGLLGKLFTSDNIIMNYNFHLFMALNNMGKFLFILDGFDEMKRMMSWESLKFNLFQINRLATRNSKMVLLGRPTAFLNEDEQREALHGIKVTRAGERRIPDWPEFEELYVRPFSTTDMSQFVKKYTNTLNSDRSYQKEQRVFKDLLKAIQHGEGTLLDIIARPVQLKMLMEILPGFKGALKELTVSELYSEFFDLVVEREARKGARRRFSKEARKAFMMELALLMWRNQRMREIASHKIPEKMVQKFCDANDDYEAAKRDLIMGSVLERKGIEGFYFSHRSFQEFLVAEQLYSLFKHRNTDFFNIADISVEIREFFIDLIGRKSGVEFKKWVISYAGTDGPGIVEKISPDLAAMFSELCAHYSISNPIPITKKRVKSITLLEVKSDKVESNVRAVGILAISKKANKLRQGDTNKKMEKYPGNKKLVKKDYSKRG